MALLFCATHWSIITILLWFLFTCLTQSISKVVTINNKMSSLWVMVAIITEKYMITRSFSCNIRNLNTHINSQRKCFIVLYVANFFYQISSKGQPFKFNWTVMIFKGSAISAITLHCRPCVFYTSGSRVCLWIDRRWHVWCNVNF